MNYAAMTLDQLGSERQKLMASRAAVREQIKQVADAIDAKAREAALADAVAKIEAEHGVKITSQPAG